MTRDPAYAWSKLSHCIRFARECSRDYRETRDRRFWVISREAMVDARYWRDYLRSIKT